MYHIRRKLFAIPKMILSLKWNFRVSKFNSLIVNQNSQEIVKTFLLSNLVKKVKIIHSEILRFNIFANFKQTSIQGFIILFQGFVV